MRHEQHTRYARQIILPELGEDGQQALLNAKVLVVGAGGLGSPALLYLAAMGVGTLGVIDSDRVALNNLQRQIIHEIAAIGELKVDSAAETLADLNPDIHVVKHACALDTSNAREIIAGYDIVAECSDDIATRFLVADRCADLGRPLISAAIHQFQGQIATFKPYLGDNHPSYRCLYPEMPPPDAMPSCAQAGILGSVAGVMGSLQATEIVKEITGIGESLSGHLLRYDGLNGSFKKVKLPRSVAVQAA